MSVAVLRFAWYRLCATIGDRWAGYAGLVLVIGLAGGVALGSAAAARRTEASFPVFLASTNPSDLTVQYASDRYLGLPPFAAAVARLPHVKRAEFAVEPIADVLGPDGAPTAASMRSGLGVAAVASVNGLYFNQDRVAVVAGRMADPGQPDQVMVDAQAAGALGLRVGAVVPMGFYTSAQASSTAYGTPRLRPKVRIEATVVGLVRFSNELVQDDIDRPQGGLLLTPALTRTLLAAGTGSGISWLGLRLAGGAGNVAAVEREVSARLGNGAQGWFRVTSVLEGQAQDVIEPDWIALAAFAAIAALVALLVGTLAVARNVNTAATERAALRALGASPAMLAADSLLGVLAAIAGGALLAVGVALALSPVAPIGPVRLVYPSAGVAFDWTVLGFGCCLLAGFLAAAATTLAVRAAVRRDMVPPARTAGGGRAAGRLATVSGLPAPAVTGLRFAFDHGKGRNTAPARSAMLAAVVALAIVTATLTFGASLSALVSHPALYGWNWTYALAGSQGPIAVPQRQLDGALRAAPGVAAWTTVSFVTADLNGQAVPVLLGSPGAAVAPPVLSGHPVSGPGQIVLGTATLAQLHEHLGGTVSFSLTGPGLAVRDRLTIVGTATMPTVGLSDVLHTSMGTGAIASSQLLGSFGASCNGPPGITLVRLRPAVSAAAGLTAVRRAASTVSEQLATVPATDPCHGDTLGVLSVQHPAQIANYAALGAAPGLLAVTLAAGAMTALVFALLTSVRRRRRDLAVLKTIGFTARQLAATVAWQATAAAIVGSVAGIPVGIALGRWLWSAFARQIYAVPRPAVPVMWMILLPLCTVVLVNLAAALPGRAAARTPAALALRAE